MKERIARAVRMVFAAERLDLALFEEKCVEEPTSTLGSPLRGTLGEAHGSY